MLLSAIILTSAVLTCKVALMGTHMILLFLFFSGLGQFVAPTYFSLGTCAVGIFLSSLCAVVTYPLGWFLIDLCFLALGFFGRGFFACSLLYLN